MASAWSPSGWASVSAPAVCTRFMGKGCRLALITQLLAPSALAGPITGSCFMRIGWSHGAYRQCRQGCRLTSIAWFAVEATGIWRAAATGHRATRSGVAAVGVAAVGVAAVGVAAASGPHSHARFWCKRCRLGCPVEQHLRREGSCTCSSISECAPDRCQRTELGLPTTRSRASARVAPWDVPDGARWRRVDDERQARGQSRRMGMPDGRARRWPVPDSSSRRSRRPRCSRRGHARDGDQRGRHALAGSPCGGTGAWPKATNGPPWHLCQRGVLADLAVA